MCYQMAARFPFIAELCCFAKTKEAPQGNVLYLRVTFPCALTLKITPSLAGGCSAALESAVSWNCSLLLCVLAVDLLGLLNWRSNSHNIAHNLRKLMEVEGGEIVKVFAGI